MAREHAIIWTDYIKYRARLRGFDLVKIQEIVKHSPERYLDVATGRYIAVGRHGRMLIAVPYEIDKNVITPITIHATTRQQINFRLRTGRYSHE